MLLKRNAQFAQKGFSAIFVILVILIASVSTFGLLKIISAKHSSAISNAPNRLASTPPANHASVYDKGSRQITISMSTEHNEIGHFSFDLPNGWTVEEVDTAEGGGIPGDLTYVSDPGRSTRLEIGFGKNSETQPTCPKESTSSDNATKYVGTSFSGVNKEKSYLFGHIGVGQTSSKGSFEILTASPCNTGQLSYTNLSNFNISPVIRKVDGISPIDPTNTLVQQIKEIIGTIQF